MTSAEKRTIYGKTDYTRESLFLRELDSKLVDGNAIREEKKRTDGVFRDGAGENIAFKPFDQLKYARQQTVKKVAQMEKAASENYAIGDRVSHSKFGEGEVLEVTSSTIRVQFADGAKKLALGIAPIKKL